MLSTLFVSSNLNEISDLPVEASKVIRLLIQMLESNDVSAPLITQALQKLNTSFALGIAAISLFFAILGCFFGYKLAQFFMGLSGFIAGAILGTILSVRFLNASNGIVLICAIVAGIILSLLAYRIYQAGIFVLCFFLAFIAGANYIPLTGNAHFFVCTVLGFIVATLALKYVRPVIILTSAIVCASIAAHSMTLLVPHIPVAALQANYSSFLCFIILFVLGSAIQFLTTKDPMEKNRKGRNRKYDRDR